MVDYSHTVLLDLVDSLDVFIAVGIDHQLDQLFGWRKGAVLDGEEEGSLDDFLHLRVLHYAGLQKPKVLLRCPNHELLEELDKLAADAASKSPNSYVSMNIYSSFSKMALANAAKK